MPREKLKTLTEQMFYILLCLNEECRGMEVLDRVKALTGSRVTIGSGTLYDLLEMFLREGLITQTRAEGRRRSYIITAAGRELLDRERARLEAQTADYYRIFRKEANP